MKLIYFFTFAPMKTQPQFTFSPNQKAMHYKANGLLRKIFEAVKNLLAFDTFQYTNTYQEKLLIVYANIRV
ncbi:hypothetical protein GV828_07885 [Flavobacterium sp. NST-5]|uniref:Transposase n=1 Tax=Flavobacterium ichthyis TaxID=2698827 RepID=A0ABW9Z8R5_9FLAO|nr:hypothetical protein [Flavobacterium ichthyis]NBL65116.1 hypothetical protein [Flavobacterium ichthyis]